MLLRDKIICVLLILIFTGCSKYVKVNEKHLTEYRNQLVDNMLSQMGNEWNTIYQQMEDSIECWHENSLGLFKYFSKDGALGVQYQIDSIFCTNKEKNKIITAILKRDTDYDTVGDELWYFYGVKINEQWYFFPGASLAILRERYKEDVSTPMTFEQLRLLAVKYIYAGYLKKNDIGEYEINDNFFSDLTSCAWYIGEKPQTQEQWDSVYIDVVGHKWRKHKQEQYEKSKQMFENMRFYTAEELDTMKIEITE